MPKRPRIGLVLEGGGALGFAHIGALEWLEQNRIPVDLIAGTSMGALIGGLYASGMSTAELRELVSDINWDLTLSGQIPFPALAYRRKEDRIAYPNRLEFGLKHGIDFPGGLNSGQEIGFILSRTTLAYPDLASFDDLPIPFRCVATDMVSATQKVFDRGSLADALRASMSLPGIFLPMKDNGRVYTDGGLLNNLPVDVAKKMGADIILAVHLSTGPVNPKDLNNLSGVIGRTVSVVISATEMRTMELADVLLVADLKGFSSSDYRKVDGLIKKGYEAAEQKRGILSRFALRTEEYRALTAAHAARRKPAPVRADAVEVTGTSQPMRHAVEKAIRTALQGDFRPAPVETALTRITGLGRFDSLSYRILERGGKRVLEVRAQEKGHGPPFFQPAVEIDGKDQANVGFLFLGRFTFLDLGGYRSEWRTDISVGSRYGISTEYYRPLTQASPVFLAPRAFAENSKLEVYDQGERIAEYRLREYGAGADVGINFSRFAELRAGYQIAELRARRRVGDPVFPEFGIRNDAISMRFAYEGHDDAVLPRRGLRVGATFQHYVRSDEMSRMEIRLLGAQPTTPKSSFLYGVSGGTSFDKQQIGLRSFSLGGPVRLGAYGPNELLGHQYLLASAGYLRELSVLPPLAGDRLFGIVLAQAGRMDGTAFNRGVPLSATGMLAAKTAIGPVFFGGSWGDRGHRRWFFGLGRIF